MSIFLFFAVEILNVIFAFNRRKSFLVLSISILILSIIAGFSIIEENSDAALYSAYYYGKLNYNPGWAFSFSFLERVISMTGLSFYWFRTFLFIFFISIVLIGIKPFKVNPHFIILAYSFSLFVFLAVTIRFFCAFSIIVFSLQFLVGKKRRILIYLLLVLIASTFHTTVLFFLILAFIPFFNKKYSFFSKILLVIDLLGFLLSMLYYFIPSLYSSMILLFNNVAKTIFPSITSYTEKYFVFDDKIMSPLYSLSFLFYLLFFVLILLPKKASLLPFYKNEEFKNLWLVILICGVHFYSIVFALEMIRFLFVAIFCIFICSSMLMSNNYFFLRSKVRQTAWLQIAVALVFCVGFWFYTIYGRKIYGYDFVEFIEENQFF